MCMDTCTCVGACTCINADIMQTIWYACRVVFFNESLFVCGKQLEHAQYTCRSDLNANVSDVEVC